MIIPYNTPEFIDVINLKRPFEKISLECPHCHKEFFKTKNEIQSKFGPHNNRKTLYCSHDCASNAQIKKQKVKCLQCSADFEKDLNQIKKCPNNFCSRSCAATYRNTHKITGNRRSKLEIWLEEKLKELYPNLEIKFNHKDVINSELDIYVPKLNIAFELNGIFHYEPIYGAEKLASIQNNDNRKFQACLEKGIELVIIDTSRQVYVKPKTSQKYLDIITKIIEQKYNLFTLQV
jgi:hypothetical protein